MAGPYQLTIPEIKEKGALSPDSWWLVLVINPLSQRFVWGLARFSPQVTPNMVTGLGFALGLISVYFYAVGGYLWAALFYQLNLVCDQADGQLARCTGRTSHLGAALDVSNDVLLYGLRLLALFMIAHHAEPWAALVGGSLLVLYLVNLPVNHFLDRYERDTWARFAPREGGWLRRHGLLFPLHWPERHLLVLVIGPLAQLTLAAGILVVVLEALLSCAKLAKLFALARREDRRKGGNQ